MNKRKKIVVDHAKALFLEKGIQQTSIQDIIVRSGISKGTFYNYFSSKNECVAAILQQAYFETAVNRQELLLFNNAQDLHILIQQICMLSQTHEQQGLSGLIEEITHSGDKELKKIVMNYRMQEIEWLAGRLVEVFGKELAPHSLEAAIIYYGIQQNLLFATRLANQRNLKTAEKVANSVFHYMRLIINSLIHDGTAILDSEKISLLNLRLDVEKVSREEILVQLDELLTNNQLTKGQFELAEGLKEEMEKEQPRRNVINALLSPFLDSYRGTTLYQQAKDAMVKVLIYMKQQ